MKRNSVLILVAFFCASVCSAAYAADGDRVVLPPPAKSGGQSLLQALSERHTSREFADVDLTPQQLSDLLWATAGVNRSTGERTYPVAVGVQDMFVYVFNRAGVYKYDPHANALDLVEKGDHRAVTGSQSFVRVAAVNLAFVQDVALWHEWPHLADRTVPWGFAHAGAMMQNAYLYAASQGWSAVIRGSFEQAKVAKVLKLTDTQTVSLIHTIGPKP